MPEDYNNNSVTDLLAAVGGVSGSAAAIPLVFSLSTTTTAGFLGLFTTTVISLPIAVVGGLVITGMMAFSSKKILDLKSKAQNKYKKTLSDLINKSVLSADGSLCEKLQSEIRKTADNILQGLSQ